MILKGAEMNIPMACYDTGHLGSLHKVRYYNNAL